MTSLRCPMRWILPACLFAAIACGCGDAGPELVPVAGTVTLDGKPLAGASVIFVPPTGRTSTATTDSAGRYELWYTRERKGAVSGEHTVEIRTKTVEVDEAGNERPVPQQVPARYNGRSELKIIVEAAKRDYPLALTAFNGTRSAPSVAGDDP